MKKLILVLFTGLFLISCGTKETKEITPVVTSTTQAVDAKIDFSDPARMAGSSFGSFFVSMIRTGNYDMALKFTSKGSIDKFGTIKIKDKFQNFKFNYTLTQAYKSQKGDTIELGYTTNEYATGKMKKMTVVLENDTCKLVLPDNLDEFLK